MEKTITVRGVGNVSARPNCVELTMNLVSSDVNYNTAIAREEEKALQLTDSIIAIGFEECDLKTCDYNVRTKYQSVLKDGNYENVFDGYEVTHGLKILFGFEMHLLSKVLTAITECPARPEFQVRFTLNNVEEVKAELVRKATENARRKAELLCEASGVRLGKLIAIDYSIDELPLFSETNFDLPVVPVGRAMKFEPDMIKASDTATFTWELE